jgi:hypothetical protein
MVRSSLLLYSLCAASALLADDVVKNDEVAMLKTTPCDESSSDGMVTTVKDRISILETQMQDVFTDTSLGDFGAKAASARPQIHSNRLFVKVDTFLWKAFFGGTDFAVADSSIVSTTVTGDTKRADFRWRWGFRTEAGYHLPHDTWDLLANYTWFHDTSVKSVASPSGGTIIPLLGPYTSFTTNASASIHWNLRFQNLDVDLRRPYFLSRNFSVAPCFGLRNTWIDHGYSAHYANPSGTPLAVDIRGEQDFWGIGPVAGFGSEWHVGAQWWFFGSFAGAILASQYEITSRDVTTGTILTNLTANTTRMSPTLSGALGFGWHMNFNRDRNNVALRVSYEAQYWWKQNLTLDYANSDYTATMVSRYGEDLGMHGFTLDLLFDF